MASKLDQSLDTIMTDNRKNNRRRSSRHANKTKAAPVGGIQKTGKPAKPARPTQPAATSSASKPGPAKIMISGLVSTSHVFPQTFTDTLCSLKTLENPTCRYVHREFGDPFHYPAPFPAVEFSRYSNSGTKKRHPYSRHAFHGSRPSTFSSVRCSGI